MRLSISALILLAAPALLMAGAWPQEKGKRFYKLESALIVADGYYLSNGGRQAVPTVKDFTVSLYGEYGVTDRLTGILYVPLKRLAVNRQVGSASGFVYAPGGATTALGDLEAGARCRLFSWRQTVTSLAVIAGVPTGRSRDPQGLNTGDGEWNVHATLQHGISFYPVPGYVSVAAGINLRNEGYANEATFSAECGGNPTPRLLTIVRVRGLYPFKKSASNSDVGSLYAHGQRYFAYGFEVGYLHGSRAGISVEITSATDARNILAAPRFALGIFTKL